MLQSSRILIESSRRPGDSARNDTPPPPVEEGCAQREKSSFSLHVHPLSQSGVSDSRSAASTPTVVGERLPSKYWFAGSRETSCRWLTPHARIAVSNIFFSEACSTLLASYSPYFRVFRSYYTPFPSRRSTRIFDSSVRPRNAAEDTFNPELGFDRRISAFRGEQFEMQETTFFLMTS